jgi:hypothetical protein
MKIVFLITLYVLISQNRNYNNDDNNLDLPVDSIKLTNNIKFGKILNVSKGMSLYIISKDTKNSYKCLNGCLYPRPIFNLESDRRCGIEHMRARYK